MTQTLENTMKELWEQQIVYLEHSLESMTKCLGMARELGDYDLVRSYEDLIDGYRSDITKLHCKIDTRQPPSNAARRSDRLRRRGYLMHVLDSEPGTVAELRERIGARPQLVVDYHYRRAPKGRLYKCDGHAGEVRQTYPSSHLFNDLNSWLRAGKVVKSYLDDGHVIWFVQR
jgi:hypothetical protein